MTLKEKILNEYDEHPILDELINSKVRYLVCEVCNAYEQEKLEWLKEILPEITDKIKTGNHNFYDGFNFCIDQILKNAKEKH